MRARASLVASLFACSADAQWPPQQQPTQQQPYQQQQPQPWTPAPQARSGGGRTEAELREAERRDVGRGLEWFFVSPELGVTNVGLTSLSNSALLPGASAQTGTQLGVSLGARLLYFTAGLRSRLAFMPDYKMWSVGPEASFHVPMGNLEPYVMAGLGYTALGGISDPANVGIRVRGVNTRLGGGADYYFTPGFSVGGLATVETLFLSRPGSDASNAGELKNGGSSVGLALSASLVLGLHLLDTDMSGIALVWITTTWLPVGAIVALRGRGHFRQEWPRWLVAALFGAIAGAIGALAELRVAHVLALRGIDPKAPLSLVVALAFAGPLAEGATLAAAWPVSRRAIGDGAFATARAAGAAASGYLLSDHFLRLWRGAPLTWLGHLLTTVTFVMLAGSWGYMAGRAGPGAPGRKLFPTWVASALTRGLVMYVLSLGALLASLVVTPLTLLLLALGLVVREDRAPHSGVRESIYEARDELVRHERPVSVLYVLIGMLANQGALIVTVGLALYAGTRMGVPFSLIDDLGVRATLPLVVLGVAGLIAFPIAGYFVARGRREPTLVEPALSAGLAIVVTLLSLGVTSPVAFVFVLSTAPVALVLACGGAWVGMGRR